MKYSDYINICFNNQVSRLIRSVILIKDGLNYKV